ncbi:MAG: TldD/PmbA family protein [Actinobacteria bacterium]|nr:TldD/PmbA family protein [Actinomycetota bacterium]
MADPDGDFLALPLHPCADAALGAAEAAGATWADVRITRDHQRSVSLRDGRVDSTSRDASVGIGVRVIADGAWGFAASGEVTVEDAAQAARRAVAMARSVAPLGRADVILADEPVYNGIWVAPYQTDPIDVADSDVIDLLAGWSAVMASHRLVRHTKASFDAAKEALYYADSAGTRTIQQRVRCQPEATAIAVTDDGFEDMRTLGAPTARGWEYALEPMWSDDVAELGEHLAARVAAPTVPAGPYDLVIAPSNLWLTIHESVGHATEYDRAIGFEANYAGTSFATPDLLGHLQYGSPLMHITGDRTAEFGLATAAWDHEGVAAQSWDIVRGGRLVGYQLDRWGAAQIGLPRSNGCAYADDSAHVQIQRMPNVSLQPATAGPSVEALVGGVTDGLLVVGDKSWSIDMNRRNFQFTAQRFYRIRNGTLVGQVKDIAYQSDTLTFWNSLVALGGPQSYVLGGALNCGKGQPGQVAAVSHGCPAAVFEQVNVLQTGAGGVR